MDMKDHILTALREQLESWEELLVGLAPAEISAPRFDLGWSIQDVIAHLWGWQQISIARMQAALRRQEPELPGWVARLPANWEEATDQTNAWIYQTYHSKPWPEMHATWRAGYQELIELGAHLAEKELLDADAYPWLGGYSPAFILVASYQHHQEHLDKLNAWMGEAGSAA